MEQRFSRELTLSQSVEEEREKGIGHQHHQWAPARAGAQASG